jgi:glycerol uptake facilitator-like aquaporin
VALFATESWPKTQVWAFFVFPLIGGALGAVLWKAIAGDAPRVDTTITT